MTRRHFIVLSVHILDSFECISTYEENSKNKVNEDEIKNHKEVSLEGSTWLTKRLVTKITLGKPPQKGALGQRNKVRRK